MRKIKLVAVIVVLGAILMYPETAVSSAQGAMCIWYGSVAPALFPFLALMPMITGRDACIAYEMIFSRIMRPVFALPGSAAPGMIIGMISGSPGGALAICRIAGESGMRRADAKRLSLAMAGVSPAYLLMGVGQGMYGSASLGVRLVIIQLGVQLLLLQLLRLWFRDDQEIIGKPAHAVNENPIRSAVENVLAIGGYMVVFSVIAGVAAKIVGEDLGTSLLLAADLPSGLASLSGWNVPGRMFLQGLAIGFAGLCIAAQNMDALREIGVRWREYLAVRIIAAAISAVLSALVINEGEISAQQFVKPEIAYVFSLFIASIAVLPALMLVTNKLFLNKRNTAGDSA